VFVLRLAAPRRSWEGRREEGTPATAHVHSESVKGVGSTPSAVGDAEGQGSAVLVRAQPMGSVKRRNLQTLFKGLTFVAYGEPLLVANEAKQSGLLWRFLCSGMVCPWLMFPLSQPSSSGWAFLGTEPGVYGGGVR
jgi:hypothetical protein